MLNAQNTIDTNNITFGGPITMKDLVSKSGIDLPKIGEVLEGEIITAGKNNIFIDLGSLGTGIVYPGEFYDRPEMNKVLKSGQRISSILLDIETEDGFRELSLRQAQKTTAWQEIKKLKDSGEVITTTIVNINKGGAIVEIQGVQGFLPLSQLSTEHYPKVEGGDTTKIVQALQKLKNKETRIKILDFSEEEGKLIVSEKAVGDEWLKKEIEKFKIGDIIDGEITGITAFGAFVHVPFEDTLDIIKKEEAIDKESAEETDNEVASDNTEIQSKKIRGIEGLIHISEIDWKLIEDPRDFLKKGQKVKAKIINIEGTKISLSLKALKSDPWLDIDKKYSVGQTLVGTVTKVNNYGALISLDEEITGLVPASEFTGKKPQEAVKQGDKINIAIVSIDAQDHKMLLTIGAQDSNRNQI